MKIGKVSLLGVVAYLAFLAGCASTTILERADGTYDIVASSYSENSALNAAREDGSTHCRKLGKRFAMVEHRATYQGLDKNAKAVVGTINVLTKNEHHGDGSRHDDYRVEIHYVCK